MEKDIILQLIAGPMLVVLGSLYIIFPPKKINALYGYRTAFSMQSQEVWDEGNKVSSRLITGVGGIVTFIQILLGFFINGHLQLLIPVILMVLLLIATIPVTEMYLKRRFDKHGNRKSKKVGL